LQGVAAELLLSEYRLKISVFARMGLLWPNISGRTGRPTNRSSCQKTTMNDLLYCRRKWAQVAFVSSESTHSTDKQTDGRKGIGS